VGMEVESCDWEGIGVSLETVRRHGKRKRKKEQRRTITKLITGMGRWVGAASLQIPKPRRRGTSLLPRGRGGGKEHPSRTRVRKSVVGLPWKTRPREGGSGPTHGFRVAGCEGRGRVPRKERTKRRTGSPPTPTEEESSQGAPTTNMRGANTLGYGGAHAPRATETPK
jgi:hypothetical protein